MSEYTDLTDQLTSAEEDDAIEYIPFNGMSPEQAAHFRAEHIRRVVEFNLAAIRKSAGLSQAEAASAIGKSQVAISKTENSNIGSLQISTLVDYLEAIGASATLVINANGKREEYPLAR